MLSEQTSQSIRLMFPNLIWCVYFLFLNNQFNIDANHRDKLLFLHDLNLNSAHIIIFLLIAKYLEVSRGYTHLK